ncbi:MAG: aminodeoxychorismate/anthranilate synthase component II [Pseudomonadota bacterium]
MILLIDNYDSFTYNLAHLIAANGYALDVKRNDAISVQDALDLGPEAIVLSPGPSMPENAGICLDLVTAADKARTPLFGVCLGLQSIAQAFGGAVVRAEHLMHGKTSAINHEGRGIFSGLPSPFEGTRYHSLIAARDRLPSSLSVTASSAGDDEIMAVEHRERPIAAVQFHPESIASEHGLALFANFMTWAAARR